MEALIFIAGMIVGVLCGVLCLGLFIRLWR